MVEVNGDYKHDRYEKIVKNDNDNNNDRTERHIITDPNLLTAPRDRLVGLVVKASASRAGGPRFESR